MELEFDKEIDAILRRVRGGGASSATASAGHVDADAIAAFAENALPQAARSAYVSHFADCDDCRTRLAAVMPLANESGAEADPVASSAATVTAPWYKAIFRTPGLAFAMGALVLAFSGLLAFVVVQNSGSDSSLITQQTENRSPAEGLSPFGGATANVTATNAANAPPAATGNANSVAAPPADPALREHAPDYEERSVAKEKAPEPERREENAFSRDGVVTDAAKPDAAPPPPPTTTTEVTGRAETKDEDAKGAGEPEDDRALSKRKMTENRRRDAPPAASKSGPSRSGPLQNQTNQINSNIGEMSVTRSVGGKKFNNRDGVWYDTAYRGQATTNYRRSSTDYKSLDSGLRSIANELGGTVVIVWKGKAYRID